jgi:proline utilization trans-activator
MCALQMHIESADMQLTQPITLTPTVSSLLLSCIDSAQTILKMLRVLGEEDLLGK